MKIYHEMDLKEFQPWAGAIPRFKEAEELGLLPAIEEMF